MQTVRTMPLAELRARVEEAEKLLRVAKQLARNELSDPQQSSRARDRIGSIVSEVQGMFPGLGEADGADLRPQRLPGLQSLENDGGRVEGEGETAAAEDEEYPEDPEEDEDEEAEAEEQWELDCDRLRAALANDALMGQIPEPERPRFRAMAERLLEVHERGELYSRILAGFEELAEVTRAGAEAVQRHLAALLTFGGPAALTGLRGISEGGDGGDGDGHGASATPTRRGALAGSNAIPSGASSGPASRPKYKA